MSLVYLGHVICLFLTVSNFAPLHHLSSLWLCLQSGGNFQRGFLHLFYCFIITSLPWWPGCRANSRCDLTFCKVRRKHSYLWSGRTQYFLDNCHVFVSCLFAVGSRMGWCKSLRFFPLPCSNKHSIELVFVSGVIFAICITLHISVLKLMYHMLRSHTTCLLVSAVLLEVYFLLLYGSGSFPF